VTARARGVTLIELMVALAITGVVLAALFTVVQGQQTAFYDGNLQRAAQSSARTALSYVEQRVATAGFGMDASLAFDFTNATAPCPPLAVPCQRDRVDGNDELVFFARNPRYWTPDAYTADPVGNAWRIITVGAGTVTVSAHANDTFVKGRILQAVCRNSERYAYFTVSQTATVGAAPNPTFPIMLTAVTASDPFQRQDQATAACFNSGEARMFLIDRFRFHVRPVPLGATTQPYLVMDPGLDANNNGPDDADEVVVAEGIESFQVGYEMTSALLAPRGTVPGTAIAFAGGFPGATAGSAMTTLVFPGVVNPGQTDYQPTSWYGYSVGPPPDTTRTTDHQANIRAVRVSIVARGPDPDPRNRRTEILLPVLNQNALPAWIDPTVAYHRTRVDATIPARNMVARAILDH
jgi:type IV pilus assembly protein PilW